MDEPRHVSVLLKECIDNLNIDPEGVYVDGTLGLGGHSLEIAKRLAGGRLVCIDRDETAIERAGKRLEAYRDKISFVHGNFSDTAEILRSLGLDGADGMLFDLGVSSPQLDESARGFSYQHDAPLDMRMDASAALTAYTVVNDISAAILARRSIKPIETTGELAEIIRRAMPAAALREKQHPAKRSFQAIRIAVNDELGEVERMMDTAPDMLRSGGRLCVISFHSLEDRIVKTGIARRENGCTCPREAPICTCGFVQTLRSVTRKPILPSEQEIEENPRARSAKLRVAEKI